MHFASDCMEMLAFISPSHVCCSDVYTAKDEHIFSANGSTYCFYIWSKTAHPFSKISISISDSQWSKQPDFLNYKYNPNSSRKDERCECLLLQLKTKQKPRGSTEGNHAGKLITKLVYTLFQSLQDNKSDVSSTASLKSFSTTIIEREKMNKQQA